MKKACYFCYTDGSCKKSEGAPGGWGLVVKCPDGSSIEKYDGALKTTIGAMELTAIVEALRVIPAGAHATIFSDSQSALDYCGKWIPIWKRNGWKAAPVETLELLKNIDALLTEKTPQIEWSWIRGHRGNQGNERADELAAQGARQAKAKLRTLAKKRP